VSNQSPTTTLTREQEDTLVHETVRGVLALRKLTRDTRTQTSKSQGALLQALSPAVLTRVAVILAEMEEAPVTSEDRGGR
jgi:hypothetical protein